mmetsp:Transcript_6967/g.9628  ORF Transcript_6967/g.9628 Transcript_6967/m.9628 type:complete len:196 (-) Transcript_6967:40-627(-)
MTTREYKLVILGPGGVGKSALVVQMTQNHFITQYDPTIENSFKKQITIDNDTYILDIMDTAGQEEYSVMRDQHIGSGQGFLLVYSIINKASFDAMQSFYDQILRVKEEDSYPVVLVGNKCDLTAQREVATKDGEELAKNIKCPFYETSAKNRVNVQESFHTLVKQIRSFNEGESTNSKDAPKKEEQKKSGCCTLL